MLKNVKFRVKILIFPIIFVFILIAIFAVSTVFNQRNKTLLSETKEVFFPSIEMSINLSYKLLIIQKSLQDAVAAAEIDQLAETDSVASDFSNTCLSLANISNDKPAIDSISKIFEIYYVIAKDVSQKMIIGGFSDSLNQEIEIMIESYNRLSNLLSELENNNKKKSDIHFVSIEENINSARTINFIIFIFSIVFVLFISYLIINSIVKPMNKTVGYLKKMSEKDISFQIEEKRKDEIGELYVSINEINKNFRQIIQNISTSTKAVLGASNQLALNSNQITRSANQQATITEEVSSSMEEILATIQSNTDKANNTSKISSDSASKMEKNKEVILESLNAIVEISGKISIISEIADKTDILSINAAIEAARAGETGRGFAVVANEIRKLADKTKNASLEIDKLSSSSREISQISAKHLEKIIPEIVRSAELISDIVLASQEQEINVEAVNDAVLQLAETTNENSASAEELSSSAEELNAQAKHLLEMIFVFKL